MISRLNTPLILPVVKMSPTHPFFDDCCLDHARHPVHCSEGFFPAFLLIYFPSHYVRNVLPFVFHHECPFFCIDAIISNAVIPAISFNVVSLTPVTGFVSMSAGFSSPGTQCTVMSHSSAHSLTKCYLRHMCFVRLWKSGLYERVDAPRLSVHTLGVVQMFEKVRIFPNHITSCTPTLSVMYSASVDDSVVTSCFHMVHDSALVPVVTSTPLVAFSSYFSSSSSSPASVNTSMLSCHAYRRIPPAQSPTDT